MKVAIETNETIGQMVTNDFRKAEIFKKYGIDFCCGGKKTLMQACAEKGLDPGKLEAELMQLKDVSSSARPLPYNEWGLDFLADYIVNTHHVYVKKALPQLIGYATKVATVHGKHHPELPEIKQLVDDLAYDLLSHMKKEENILFPYIKRLAASPGGQQGGFGSVQQPISVMQMEHEAAAGYIEDIKRLSNNYAIPQDACATYTVFYKMLEEFEDDLHLHVHLENNILFPKAVILENENAGN